MCKYQPTIDIWTLTPEQRAKLQPGQWVTAGPHGDKGVFLGERPGCTVVAWLGNARAHRKSKGRGALGYGGYIAKLREYAKGASR